MKYCIGPMSKNVVDSVIDFVNNNNVEIGLIPSRRQVDYFGGYVNHWNTKTFVDYVKSKTHNIKIIRDHGGEFQGSVEDDGVVSFFIDSVFVDGIHVDVWKKNKNLEDAILSTIKNIKHCLTINDNLFFEIGTEQSIREYSADELDYFIENVKNGLADDFCKVKYAVIQCGTSLKSNINTGNYSETKLIDMLSVVKKHGLMSKEHNGDYTTKDIKYKKFSNGLDCINIAPEFGLIETETILESMKEYEFQTYFDICYSSNKWKKWVNEDFDPHNNKNELIKICGHYVRTDSWVDNYVVENNLNDVIKTNIYSFLESLY